MTDALLITLLAAFTACVGYAVGRLHQWYRTGVDRDEAYRDGYDTATRSVFSMAARLIGPRRAVRGTAVVTSAVITTAPPVPGNDASRTINGFAGGGVGVEAGGAPPAASLRLAEAAGSPAVATAAPPFAAPLLAELPLAAPPLVEPPLVARSPLAEPAIAESPVGGVSVGGASVGGAPVGGSSVDGAPVAGPSVGAPPVAGPPIAGPSVAGPRQRRRARDGAESALAPSPKEAEAVPPSSSGGGRHLVPDELVQAPTYRLAPDRVARAKVRGAVPADDGELETTRLPSVPRPRSS